MTSLTASQMLAIFPLVTVRFVGLIIPSK